MGELMCPTVVLSSLGYSQVRTSRELCRILRAMLEGSPVPAGTAGLDQVEKVVPRWGGNGPRAD